MTTFNPYETRKLVGLVANLVKPSSFINNMFFKNEIQPTGQRKIQFDVEGRNKGIALFCSPMSEGRVIKERGFSTKDFEPAYVKPWMDFNPMGVLERQQGEQPGGDLSPPARQKARLVRGYADLYQLIGRRVEAMSCQAAVTGKNTISGDGIPVALEVDYGRAAGFTITLSGGARWGQSGVLPISSIETWAQLLSAEHGVAPNRVVFDFASWGLFRLDPGFDKLVDITYKRQTSGTQLDSLALGPLQQGLLMGVLRTGGANLELWVYNQSYVDENGAAQTMVPANTVLMGYEGDPDLSQTMCWGTVIDPELGYQSEALIDPATGARLNVAPWHAFAQKPAIGERIGLTSAPLTAMTRPNALLSATVT